MIGIIIRLLSGTMVIRPERFKKRKSKKSSYPFLGTHQDIEIGVCQKAKKKEENNCI